MPPGVYKRTIKPLLDRLMVKVDMNGPVPALVPGNCWVWTGSRNRAGYGLIQTGSHTKSQSSLAHRIAWQLLVDAIPVGMSVLHHCDNPPCVNPRHLFIGTLKDNAADMAAKGRGVYQVHPEKAPRGTAHKLAKLDEQRVSDIRVLLQSGVALRELSRRYGVDRNAIAMIRDRRTWRHVA